MINTFFTILILVFAAFFAIGTTVMIAQEKRKERAAGADSFPAGNPCRRGVRMN